MKRGIRVGKPLRVTWEDAWFAADYYTSEEMAQAQGKFLKSYGLCVSDTKEGLSIVMDELPEKGQFRDVKFIPRGMLREVKILK